MSKAAKNAAKALAKSVFVFLLSGLLLLPGNSAYAFSDGATVELEFPESMELLESVEFPEGTELPESEELLDSAELPEGIQLPEDGELSERAAVYPQNVTLLTAKSITSTDADGNEGQPVKINIPSTTSKSLWFKDGTTANQIVRTYRDPSVPSDRGHSGDSSIPGGNVQSIYKSGWGRPSPHLA